MHGNRKEPEPEGLSSPVEPPYNQPKPQGLYRTTTDGPNTPSPDARLPPAPHPRKTPAPEPDQPLLPPQLTAPFCSQRLYEALEIRPAPIPRNRGLSFTLARDGLGEAARVQMESGFAQELLCSSEAMRSFTLPAARGH